MKVLVKAALGVAGVGLMAAPSQAQTAIQHVLLISVDGLHALDLENYVASHPQSVMAKLSQHGVTYTNALTTAPSDSFPGMLAQVTGGTSKTTGVYYDDSYDRTFFPPSSGCVGAPGAEVVYAEKIDVDQSRYDAGGILGQPLTQIDPAKLPQAIVKGVCTPVVPHKFGRANNVFELIRASGGYTAWSDKHPAYEILNGPSGRGLNDLFTPEINSLFAGGGTVDNTGSFTATQRYDHTKVQAIVNEINGLDSTGQYIRRVPTLFGMNFQAVSVGQKLAKAGPTDPANLIGGYLDPNGAPNTGLASALDFVDGSLGEMVTSLANRGLTGSTLIIVSAKHGQSPIDVTQRVALDDSPYAATPGYGFHIADDVALVWLQPQTQQADYAAAESYLQSQFTTLGIAELLPRSSLTLLFQNPFRDSRTPDFITLVDQGVIYTGGSKLAEHGGFARDDRNVALLVSNPGFKKRSVTTGAQTTQIAPSILTALGLDPAKLQAVRKEGTTVLPALF